MTSAESASLILMPSNPKRETIPRTGTGTGAEAKGKPAAAWPEVEERLRSGESIVWLSLRTDDGVHTRPVFAAWTGTSFVVASNATAVKSHHLDTGDQCSLALDLGATHLTVDAHPVRLTEQHDLERASGAFRDVYNWPTTVAGNELDAPYAAPTSGGPPFRVYELTPVRAFAFSASDQFEPTRFVF
jgi:hypothetical protein